MDHSLSYELRHLVYAALLALVMWIPYVLAQLKEMGVATALSYPDEEKMPAWAWRLKRAHYNLIENLAPFAAVVISGEIIGVHTTITASCAAIFYWARLCHPFAQVFRIWGMRTVFFAIGWAATIVYLLAVLYGAT